MFFLLTAEYSMKPHTKSYMESLLSSGIQAKKVKCGTLKKSYMKGNQYYQSFYPEGGRYCPETWIESWGGNFIMDDGEYFVTYIQKSYKYAKVKVQKGRKIKEVVKLVESDEYEIWCRGNDDLAMSLRNIGSLEEAKKVFDQIIDGITQEELHVLLGIQYDC
jgi:hypothetical protein